MEAQDDETDLVYVRIAFCARRLFPSSRGELLPPPCADPGEKIGHGAFLAGVKVARDMCVKPLKLFGGCPGHGKVEM